MNARTWLVAGLAVLLSVQCTGRKLFDRGGPMVERANPTIPPGRYRVLASIAGGGTTRLDLQVSVTVRQQLEDSGVTVVRRAGRWQDENAALQAICAPDAVPVVDGVLFTWYDRLELRDCATGTVAFEISGTADKGILDMTGRLIQYLRRPPPAMSDAAPSQD
jgi:hypothetical protein